MSETLDTRARFIPLDAAIAEAEKSGFLSIEELQRLSQPQAGEPVEDYKVRHDRMVDYSIDLQRIIEDLCAGRDIREPATPARHHYLMAVQRASERADNPVTWDECAATGRSCEYEPQGPSGERQCQYCGKPASPQPANPAQVMGFDAAELDMIRHGDMLGRTLGARVYAALAALGVGEQAVAVKPLEWIDTGQRGFLQCHHYAVSGTLRHPVHPLDSEEGSFFEHYSIEHRPRETPPWKLVYWVGNNGLSGINNSFETIDAAKAAAQADYEQRILSALPQPHPADEHPDDRAVDQFAVAMKTKLAKKRAEGRGGWDNRDECSPEYLSHLLIQHCLKGDPLDVGNFAMMLHQRGDRIVIDEETQAIMDKPHPADERVVEALRELTDKLNIARIDSKDEAFRKAAQYAIDIATAAISLKEGR